MNFEIFEKFMLRRNFRVMVDNKIEPLIKFSSDFAMLLQSQFYIQLVDKATLSFKLKLATVFKKTHPESRKTQIDFFLTKAY